MEDILIKTARIWMGIGLVCGALVGIILTMSFYMIITK